MSKQAWPVAWFRVRVSCDSDNVPVATIWCMNTPEGARLLTVAGTGRDARTLDAQSYSGQWVTRDHQWTNLPGEAHLPGLAPETRVFKHRGPNPEFPPGVVVPPGQRPAGCTCGLCWYRDHVADVCEDAFQASLHRVPPHRQQGIRAAREENQDE